MCPECYNEFEEYRQRIRREVILLARQLQIPNEKVEAVVSSIVSPHNTTGATHMAAPVSDLQPIIDQVTAITSVDASVIMLLQSLSSQLSSAQNDPATIATIATNLSAQAAALSAAITANTPVTPSQAKAKH